MPRILILTAGFGEGHNTAARCTREALEAACPGVEARVLDPIERASPRLTALARKFYLGAINHTPKLWEAIYQLADICPVEQPVVGPLAAAARVLHAEIAAFAPDALVSTYPVYSALAPRGPSGGPFWPCPFHTIVTDSITINTIWSRGHGSTWCVTDPISASRLSDQGVPPESIHVTGFPVSPRFAGMARRQAVPTGGEPLRVLYFPIDSAAHTKNMLDALAALPRDPAWALTVVLGRQKDRLRPMVEQAMADGRLPPGVEIIGWTDRIPELLNSHHVVLGKAGGATVHESRAAARPMLIHYMVPGQEEGNALLLEAEQGGRLLPAPCALPEYWRAWTTSGCRGWLSAHEALLAACPADPAFRVARVILDSLSLPFPPTQP